MWQVCCRASAVARETLATTLAEGCRSAISRARLGPVTTAIRSGATLAGLGDHLAHPQPGAQLDALGQADHDGRRPACDQPARLPRSDCDGTASTTNSAPSMAAAGSLTARTVAGRSMVGK